MIVTIVIFGMYIHTCMRACNYKKLSINYIHLYITIHLPITIGFLEEAFGERRSDFYW